MKTLINYFLLLIILSILSCKNNNSATPSQNRNISPKHETNNSTLSSSDLNFLNEDYKFFNNYFSEILNQKVKTSTKLDSLVFLSKKTQENFLLVSYETDCGFWAKLYKVNIGNSTKDEFIGIIGADQNIWGSQYYLTIWEKSDSSFYLIDKIESSNSIKSISFSKENSANEDYSLNIHFELDLTSAYSGEGISYWKIQDNKLIKWKKDRQNFKLNSN